LSIVSINNIEDLFYLLLINKDKIVLQYKIIKAIYKTTLNKILEINNITNRVFR